MADEEAFEDELKPAHATSEEQFVVMLRRLRERSGLTFKQIERRAAGGPVPLPASTLATALQRRTAPRAEIVSALVRVCGGGPEIVDEWLALRERLVHPLPAPGAEVGPEPLADTSPGLELVAMTPGPNGRRRPSGRAVAAVCVVVVLAGTVTVLAMGGSSAGGGDPADPAATPSGGAVTAPPTTSGLPVAIAPGADLLKIGRWCLTERADDQAGRIYLADCARSFPPRRLERAGNVWRVTTRHPRFGPGCMGVVDGSSAVGADISDDTCGRIQTERYLLRAVEGGYHLVPEGHELCVGVPGTPRRGAMLKQLRCDPKAPGQRFTVSRRA